MPTAQAWVSMLLLFVRVFSGPKEWNSRHRIPRFFLFVFLWDVDFIGFNALLADCFRWVALLGVLGNYIIIRCKCVGCDVSYRRYGVHRGYLVLLTQLARDSQGLSDGQAADRYHVLYRSTKNTKMLHARLIFFSLKIFF